MRRLQINYLYKVFHFPVKMFYSWKSFSLLLMVLSVMFSGLCDVTSAYEVIYAVNCGGPRHTDKDGIKYRKDDNSVGVASDYGMSMSIARAHPADMILYQTERYNNRDFSYDVQISSDGDYVLVLKFVEVYFQSSNEKIFDVVLNSQHTVVSNLDIFSKVGRAVAHDEIIPFSVNDGQFTVSGDTSDFDGTLVIEFVKGSRDNPKINAIVVAKGKPPELPSLMPLEAVKQQNPKRDGDVEWGDTKSNEKKFKRTSGPRVADPYSSDDSWFWPITIAVAIFLPVLFCLCRVR